MSASWVVFIVSMIKIVVVIVVIIALVLPLPLVLSLVFSWLSLQSIKPYDDVN